MRIYIDVEATEGGELLQIGCVTEENQRFGVCVRPEFTPVTPRITALTGITADDARLADALFPSLCNLVNWALEQDKGNGIHFFSFGKNDAKFFRKTLDMYKNYGTDPNEPGMKALAWMASNITNCQSTIYNAYRQKGLSLRSYFLTMNNQPLPDQHNALVDAVYLYKIMTAIDSGWTLPEGAEIIKFIKPALPSKVTPAQAGGTLTQDLNRKVVAYWVNSKGKENTGIFSDCMTAAKALCQAAVQAGRTHEQAGYGVLNAAITGTSYCGRQFFLVG